jgi:hypothetical protein
MPTTFQPNVFEIPVIDPLTGASLNGHNQAILVRAFVGQVIPFGWQWGGATLDLPDGFIGHEYLADWTFILPTTLTLTSGSLPPGLTLTQVSAVEAKIDGTPTTIGTYNFTLRATVGFSFGASDFRIVIQDDPEEGSAFVGGV